MTTLISILLGYLAYDKEKAIYAKFVKGRFSPESPAIMTNTNRKLSVILSVVDKDYIYFSRNDRALDFMQHFDEHIIVPEDWSKKYDEEEALNDFIWEEAAEELINIKNQIIEAVNKVTESKVK